MPNTDQRSHEPALRRIFIGNHERAEHEEKVLRYIIHRVSESVPLREVVQEDYVRRNCLQAKVDEILNAPELVHACRENLWQTFESGELDPRGTGHAMLSRSEGSGGGDDVVRPGA
jgi:hypothetical protein